MHKTTTLAVELARGWFCGVLEHEGFPLMLRFPERPDFDVIEKRFPKLLVIAHQLENVTASGLPDPDYNDSLADLDLELVSIFEAAASGIAVLVETFAGRRSYYFYVEESAVAEAQHHFAEKYSGVKLEWKVSEGNGCRLIRRYAADYRFYEGR